MTRQTVEVLSRMLNHARSLENSTSLFLIPIISNQVADYSFVDGIGMKGFEQLLPIKPVENMLALQAGGLVRQQNIVRRIGIRAKIINQSVLLRIKVDVMREVCKIAR